MRTGGHWSEPAARRTLDALVRLGGKATTFQIQAITHSVAVHQDVYCLRCWLQFEHGYPERDTELAVRTEHLGLNESGRQVVQYVLRHDVLMLHRRLRVAERVAEGSLPPLHHGCRCDVVGARLAVPASPVGAGAPARPVGPIAQSLLFDLHRTHP